MSESNYILDEEILASNGQRFLNYVVDYAFTYAFSYMLGLLIPFLVNFLDSIGVTGFGIWVYSLSNIAWIFISILLSSGYYFLTEGVFGITLGKLITGTVVVDENGLKPDFRTIFKRTLCRSIPFDALSFLGSSRTGGWHDSISNTYVVNKQALEEDMKMFHELKLIGVEEVV